MATAAAHARLTVAEAGDWLTAVEHGAVVKRAATLEITVAVRVRLVGAARRLGHLSPRQGHMSAL